MSDKPEILYHYCDVGGFMGIVQAKCLWLSHIYYMNDYKEHQCLLDKANQYIFDLAKQDDQKYIKHLLEPFTFIPIPFICCFSAEPDLLSQWRAYTDDGNGFAIGFSAEKLEEALRACEDIRLAQVIYDEDKHNEEVEQRINSSLEWVKTRGHLMDNLLQFEAIKTKANIWRAAARCKTPGFREENEWRIIMTPSVTRNDDGSENSYGQNTLSPLCFRSNAKKQIVSYFKLPFTPDVIAEIRLGPKNYARDDRDTLDAFLAENGWASKTIRVINSEATYH